MAKRYKFTKEEITNLEENIKKIELECEDAKADVASLHQDFIHLQQKSNMLLNSTGKIFYSKISQVSHCPIYIDYCQYQL